MSSTVRTDSASSAALHRRGTADVAIRVEPTQQQVVIQHSLLWLERSENLVKINRGPRDKNEIASNARVVHGKDIEPAQPAEQDDRGCPWADSLMRQSNAAASGLGSACKAASSSIATAAFQLFAAEWPVVCAQTDGAQQVSLDPGSSRGSGTHGARQRPTQWARRAR